MKIILILILELIIKDLQKNFFKIIINFIVFKNLICYINKIIE